jgi:RNA polymerase sigma factor (sigma-70 family)
MASAVTQLSWNPNCTAIAASDRDEMESEYPNRDALVAAAGSGDTNAFERLYEQTSPRVFKTLCRITRNREDAEDALQDSYLNAFLHLKDFDGRSSFTTWFTRIAINSALMILRKKRIHPEHPIDEGVDIGANAKQWMSSDGASNPEKLYAQNEREQILKEAVGNLRPTIRKAVELGQLQDRSMKETANLLGISVAATKARVFHARAALRRSRRLKSMGKDWFARNGCTLYAATRFNRQQHV